LRDYDQESQRNPVQRAIISDNESDTEEIDEDNLADDFLRAKTMIVQQTKINNNLPLSFTMFMAKEQSSYFEDKDKSMGMSGIASESLIRIDFSKDKLDQ
jgi:hypothetical protein